MKEVKSAEFRFKMGKHVRSINDEKVIVVTNETYTERSFLVVGIESFISMSNEEIDIVKDYANKKFNLLKDKARNKYLRTQK